MDRESIRHHGISKDAVAENHFEFDAELTLETLKSEALRSTILARIASAAFVIAIGIFTYVQWRDIPILSERRTRGERREKDAFFQIGTVSLSRSIA